jgi:hypothetical protein
MTLMTSSGDMRDVIDLRRTAAQRWLVEQFNRTVQPEGEELPALLGDTASIDALETATASASSEGQRETLTDTRTLVARAPRTFQAGGRLADALKLGSS